MPILGIDISKLDFHVHLLDQKTEAKKSFPNSAVGFKQLDTWLKNRALQELRWLS